jgi:hypothetical protein
VEDELGEKSVVVVVVVVVVITTTIIGNQRRGSQKTLTHAMAPMATKFVTTMSTTNPSAV